MRVGTTSTLYPWAFLLTIRHQLLCTTHDFFNSTIPLGKRLKTFHSILTPRLTQTAVRALFKKSSRSSTRHSTGWTILDKGIYPQTTNTSQMRCTPNHSISNLARLGFFAFIVLRPVII
ncbi:hypothetical protein B0H13DRAFT_179776 [Mycena leptocephala]|nr:hypothetical protein B0H13DRAFT_179776 [Mycena leptocephala]